MDPETPPASGDATRCCACACVCCSSPSLWQRSVKRRVDQMDDDARCNHQTDVARVEIENECTALRETLSSQQQTIQELYTELEEERSSSSTAANEAMSMILRLQREKAEVMMDSRQFKRFAEEKMAHDQQELLTVEDLLFRRDQAVQSLSCEIQAYKHRLMSYGIDVQDSTSQFDLPLHDYPPLRCTDRADLNDDATDLEKYVDTPWSSNRVNVMEKVVVGQSTGQPRHFRKISTSSYCSGSSSFLVREKGDEFPVTVDRASEGGGGDDMSDRVYTIDAVHGIPIGVCEEYVSTPREFGNKGDVGEGEEEGDIKKLYMRLQVLEADRESMRQAIISMRTDKAQLVLLREIAQQLCKEVVPERRVVKKPSFIGCFSIIYVVKWISSFVFWKKKACRSKYMFGLSSNNVGLLLLLDNSPHFRQWRCITRTQG